MFSQLLCYKKLFSEVFFELLSKSFRKTHKIVLKECKLSKNSNSQFFLLLSQIPNLLGCILSAIQLGLFVMYPSKIDVKYRSLTTEDVLTF